MPYQNAGRPATARPVNGPPLSCGEADNQDNSLNPRCLQAPRYELRFRRQVEAVSQLGPFPIACLLEEISGGADLRETVAAYTALERSIIHNLGGKHFPPSLHAIDGGRR